jgi:hypothetical protein
MLPYLIAGAIGFGIGKLFEEGGETFAGGGNIKGINLSENAKIRINYVDVSVYLDSYEDGELENVNNYDMNYIKGRIVSPKELVKFLSEEIFTSEDASDYSIMDNNIHTSQLEDEDGNEASKNEIELWKKGEIELYSANYVISVSVISELEVDEKTLSSLTGIGIYEEGGETFGRGGMTNEDILRSFLTSNRETQTNNLSTHYNQYDDFLLLRNYSTLIAIRKGNDVRITNIKYSNTTSTITNRLKALAEEMGYNVSYVSEFEEGGETFGRGGKAEKKYYWIKMDRSKIDEYIDYASRMMGMFEGEIYTQAPNKVAFDTENDMFAFTSMIDNHNNDNDFQEGDEGYIYYEELFNGEPRPNIFEKIIGNKYAGGGGVKGIKNRAEKLLEESISYRWVDTDMGSGWSFELESPLDRSVFNIIEEHTYLDMFYPEDAGIEDWDDLSEEDKDYYYQEWKEEFYQGAFENFKEKCMKHLDDFIEYLQRDSDENFAEGGEAGKKVKLNATYIPKRNIKTLTTTYGNTIKGKDLLDGAYTTRKDIRQDPKMVRTMFEEEEFAEFKNGGEAKKSRRRANAQTGRTDRSVDKTRVGKPVGYRFSNSLASKLRKDQYAVPTEKQITKYLGKGIYKENRKNRSDKDKIAKL